MKTRSVGVAALAAAWVACGQLPPANDGGTGGSAGTGGSSGADGGVTFRAFTAPATAAVPGAFLFTVTGEASATGGYAFPPPGSGGAPFFIDGWALTYEHMLVTVDNLTLSENPDMTPANPAMTGPAVARASGPWAVDLAKAGPLDAKELNGKAFALARLTSQNLKQGTPAFSTTAKYAFGFDAVAADGSPLNVNLDARAQELYRLMRAGGYAYWIEGTATWKGDQGSPACRSTNAAYDFARLPKTVRFSFGFKSPTQYRNCINPDLMPADSRGVQLPSSGEAVVQATLHNDHPFWEALEEDAPLRFDAIAARKSVASVPDGGVPAADVTNADLQGFDFEVASDAQGRRLPWRYCGAVAANERTTGSFAYDPKMVAVNPAGGAAGLADLLDYMTYNQSTFGHLNNDGVCVALRQYPSPL